LKPAQIYAIQAWFFSPATATRVKEGQSPPYPRPAQPSPQTGTIEAGAVATWNFHRRSPSAPARLSLHTITTVRLPLQPGSTPYHHRDPPSDPARLSHARLHRPASSPVRVATRCCHRQAADQFRCELPLVAATAHSVGQARCELPLAAATAHSCGQARCEVPFAAATVHSADQADASCHSLLSPYVRLLKPDASCHSRLPPPVRLIGPDAICHLLCHRHLEEQARCEMRIAYPICVSYSLQRHLAR
jgi:hypothetical protein